MLVDEVGPPPTAITVPHHLKMRYPPDGPVYSLGSSNLTWNICSKPWQTHSACAYNSLTIGHENAKY
jgi:hypothetical protein